MKKPVKNPAQCLNTATGQPNRSRKQSIFKRQKLALSVKHRISFLDTSGVMQTINANTRLADVLVKLAKAGSKGITALDFPHGVRLGGIVFILRGNGMTITTTRERVIGDPFGAVRAVYRTSLRLDADCALPMEGA